MVRRRSFVAVALIALVLPLLLGATTAQQAAEGHGDARAGLLGAHLEVEGLQVATVTDLLGDLVDLGLVDTRIDLGLLDGATEATTRDVPDARASLSPVRVGDLRPHDVAVGPGERHDADATTVTNESALLSAVALTPFSIHADADEDGAVAVIDALTASVDALGAGGLDIGLTEVRSEVTRTAATASQDLQVDDLAIALGDVLPAELLELLPLDVLLELLEGLDEAGILDVADGLRSDLEGGLAEVSDLIDAVNTEVAELELTDEVDLVAVGDLLGDRADLLEIADDLSADAATLEGVLAILESLEGLSLTQLLDITSLLDDLGSIATELESVRAHVEELDADEPGLTAPDGCTDPITQVDTLSVDLIDDLLGDAQRLDACVEDLRGQVSDLLADVLAALGLEVDGLDALLSTLLGLLGELEVALDGLLEAIMAILGEVDGIAGLPLLTADTLELEVDAFADAAGGATSIVCSLGGVAVLGQPVGDLDCVDGQLTGDATAVVDDLLGTLGDVLTTLPGVDSADGLSLRLLPESRESVTEEDGTVTATAQAVLLELAVPSVTIDPAAFVGGLLDLPSLLDDLVGEVAAELEPLTDLLEEAGLGDLLAEVSDALGVVSGLVGQVTGLIADVELVDLSVLDTEVSTPSISLVLDPVSEASFTPADVPVDPADPTDPTDPDDPDDPDERDDPAPRGDAPTLTAPTPEADDDTPALPKTGAGIPLLGLLLLLGAAGLRRTG